MTLAEPDVTLTDSVLTIECAILAWLSPLVSEKPRLRSKAGLSSSSAPLVSPYSWGARFNGFIHDKASLLHTVVWYTTLLASGVATLSAWMSGTNLVFHARARKTC